MKLVKAGFTILNDVDGNGMLKAIEAAGRTCYKSEEKISSDSAAKFVKGIIAHGHESVLEHQSISVRIVCDRGVSHELVRHRIASFSQESTRYCNYGGGVSFIIPPWVNIGSGEWTYAELEELCNEEPGFNTTTDYTWVKHLLDCEHSYCCLVTDGWQPQQARAVLPNSLKTEIVVTQNLRQWRHFFKLRAAGSAGKPHPQMLEITIPMLMTFNKTIPIVFEDIVKLLPDRR